MAQEKLQLRGVHVFEKVNTSMGGSIVRLTKINPYVRLGMKEQVLYIQNGKVFSEEGGIVPADQLPAWFSGEVEKVSKAVLRECGWQRKE